MEYFSHFTKKLINRPIFLSRVVPLHLPSLFVGHVLIILDIRNMTLKLSGFFRLKGKYKPTLQMQFSGMDLPSCGCNTPGNSYTSTSPAHRLDHR
jgi:hypothetical protein